MACGQARVLSLLSAGLRAQQPEPRSPATQVHAISRAISAAPPPLLMLVSIVSVQLGAAFAVRLFASVDPIGVAFLRLGFSALLLLAAARPRLSDVGAHVRLLILFGAVIAWMNLCFYQSIARIPLGIAVTIEFIGPLAVAVASSRRVLDFLWVALAVCGVVLLKPEVGGSLDPRGLIFAALAGGGWACFVLLSRRVGGALPGNAGLALAMAAGSALLLPVALYGHSLARLDPLLLGSGFAIAVLATAIPFTLEFAALKRLSPRGYGVLVTLEPAVAVAIGAVLLGQAATPRTLLAATLVITAAVGVTLFDRRG
jgi:inner membrane transporter RhtA